MPIGLNKSTFAPLFNEIFLEFYKNENKREAVNKTRSESRFAIYLWGSEEDRTSTITNLRNAKPTPKTLEREEFSAILLLALNTGKFDIDWIKEFLRTTDLVVTEEQLRDYLYKLLQEARFWKNAKQIIPTEEEIDEAMINLYPDWLITKKANSMGTTIPLKYIKDKEEIVAYFDYLFEKGLEQSIKAAVFGGTKSPPELAELIASHIEKRNGKPKYDVVITKNKSSIDDNFIKLVDAKVSCFDKVRDSLDLRILDAKQPLGQDIVIIDYKHVVFVISEFGDEKVYEVLFLENQDNIAKRYAEWFDRYLYPDAEKYQDVRQDWLDNNS